MCVCLRDISLGQLALGATPAQALNLYDILTIILDNCTTMAGVHSGLAAMLQELRLFSFYWLKATGVRGDVGEFECMINEHCQRHVDEIESTAADAFMARDEQENGDLDGTYLARDAQGTDCLCLYLRLCLCLCRCLCLCLCPVSVPVPVPVPVLVPVPAPVLCL